MTVDASNWIMALGQGLDAIGAADAIDRLACEVLPNGTVIARDVRTGSGYVVQPVGLRGDPKVLVDGDDEHTVLMMEPGPDDFQEASGDDVFSADFTDGLIMFDDDDEDTVAFDVEQDDDLLDRVTEAHSITSSWQIALEVSQQLVPAEAGAALRREDDGALRFVGASGTHARQLLAISLPSGTGVVGFCVDRSTSLIIRNPYSDPRFFQGVDKATGFSTRAILCVPVKDGAAVLGCLELLNPPGAQAFSRGSIDTIERVAQSLAARIADLR